MALPRGQHIAKWKGVERLALYKVDPYPLGWLLDLLHDACTIRVETDMSGGRYVGLGWREIHYWIEGSGQHDVQPRFRRDILRLSAAYAGMANAAQEMACEAPYKPDG